MSLRAITKRLKAGVILVLIAALGLSPLAAPLAAHADAPACTISPTLVNSCRPWLGSTVRNYTDAPKPTGIGPLDQVLWQETRMGSPGAPRQNDIVHTYHGVGDNQLSNVDLYFARRAGTMLFTDWNPVTNWGDIATQNAAIDSMAASINQLGNAKVFLTLWHEPENDVSPGGDPNCTTLTYKGTSGTVQQYKDMWSYVENRFRNVDGVNNVVWVMDYMNYSPWDCLVPDLYPGNQTEIDWVMYNAYTTLTATSQPNLNSLVDHFHGLLQSKNIVGQPGQPAEGIVEWGITGPTTSSTTTSREMTYYDQAKAMVENPAYHYLKAYMHFDEQDQGLATGTNFRVGYDDNGTKDPAKGAHYYAFANDPAFNNATYGSLADTVAPSAPASLTATATDAHTINLSWQPAIDYGGVTNYKIYRDGNYVTTVSNPTQPINAVTPVPVTYTDTVPTDLTTYQYSVVAYDAAGNFSTPSTGSVTTPDGTAPSTPTGVIATAPNSNEVDLTWTASTDNSGTVASYQIFKNNSPVPVATVSGTTTSYQDPYVTPQTPYSYNVAAVDAIGNTSAQSPAATVTTPALPDTTPPAQPMDLSATANTVGQVDLNWDASTDDSGTVASYTIARGDGLTITVPGTITSYSDATVAPLTTYSYTVTAADAAGNNSVPSDPATVTTLPGPDTTPPTNPTELTASLGSNEIDLSWTAATDDTGVTGYRVYRSVNGANAQLLTTVTGTSYPDTAVTQGNSYAYTVTAVDAANNESAPSNLVTVNDPDVTPPSQPTGVTATALGTTSIQLSWTASTDNLGVTSYLIQRGDGYSTTVTGTSYVDTGLHDLTTYSYTVSALDAAGNNSMPSASASATTPDGTPPSTPGNFAVTLTGAHQVTLSWDASTDNSGTVSGYVIYRNNAVYATIGNVTSLVDDGLADAVSYSYAVIALDAAGNSSTPTATLSIAVPDSTPPSTPIGLLGVASSGHQINLSWTASTDNVSVTGYNIYRNNIWQATVTGTSYSDMGLTDATTYSYTVSALDAASNESAKTPVVNVTTPDVTPPSTPTNLTATPASGTAVNLSWTGSTDNVAVTGYRVYRGSTLLTTVTGTTYQDTGLTSATTYQYYVMAIDAAGNGAASTTATVTTPDVIAPTVPGSVVATPASNGHQINLSWTGSTDNVGVTGYRIQRGDGFSTTVTGTSYTDSGLTDATTYSYTVTAVDAAGNSSTPSAVVSASTPDVTAPNTPTGLSAGAVSATQINLAWTASTDNVGVAGYNIYRNNAFVTTVTTTSYSDTGLTSSTTYQYTVSAIDAAHNESAKSTTASATTLAPPDTTAPTKPTNFKGTAASATQINLSWTAATDNVGVTGYNIYRKGVLLTTVGVVTSYQDTTVAPNTGYTYKIEAFDAAGNVSAQATSAFITTPADTTPPSQPASLTLTPGTKSMKLVWTASTDNVAVTGYRVYRGSTLITTVSGSTLTYTDTGLTSGTTYSYHIVAIDAAGNASVAGPTVSAKAL
ncbi:MAG TPA: fibronectin type III domain-containing protein [Candidatus Saccharimonadales bacterium]|nr:fibronectin type III domain-containing protein [Candidatus Saccharimonadales bacterium]